jgi:UDP-N-acetyl-D-mannosaminuronic acid dehydrogenase
VIGVDVNPQVVATVNQGQIHIVETDLDQAVADAVASGALSAQLTPSPADVFMIAVPTPFRSGSDGIPQPNIDYVLAAASAVAPLLRPGNLVLLESTSPVGTTEQVAQMIAELSGLNTDQLHIAYCPERVLPGRILQELVSNDRCDRWTHSCGGRRRQGLSTPAFCQGELLTTTARTAELVKLTENSFRDVNIAFANELSLVCDRLGINVRELIRLANHHPRVNVLQPWLRCGWPLHRRRSLVHCRRSSRLHPPDPDGPPRERRQKPLGDRAGSGSRIRLGRPTRPSARIGCLWGWPSSPMSMILRESPALHITPRAAGGRPGGARRRTQPPWRHLHHQASNLAQVLADADLLCFSWPIALSQTDSPAATCLTSCGVI